MPFAEQVKRKDAVYDVQFDFDLNKANVTIPKGCVLLFSGGSLRNGTVNLNGCLIEGNARFECEITGCPSNEDIYTRWFSKANDNLFVLLRNFCSCWYDNKAQITHHDKKRVIHVEKGDYTVTEGIELRYEEDLTIDFGGSTIIDNIDTYDKLRHRASSAIAMRESERIVVKNCKYKMGNQKGKENTPSAFIEIGGPHVTTITSNYDIRIVNISGETEPFKETTFVPIDILGNCYNIDIDNITWRGNVSSLINMESALGPKSTSNIKSDFGNISWPYPDNYGLMPYNITVRNVNGYDRPTSKYGYIRTAGAYNVMINNVYCRDVREVIELYQGDAGNIRTAMNITVNNVSSYWSDKMTLPNYAVSVNITRKNPQSMAVNPKNADIAMITFTDCDFQDNAKGNATDHYLIRVFGNNGMTVFKNCRIRNTQRAVRIADIINTSLLTHTTRFESCLFADCMVGIDGQNANILVRDCIFNAGESQTAQIKYRISGLSKETLTDIAAMLNVDGNIFFSDADITKPYIDISSEFSLPQSDCVNISQNAFYNTNVIPAVKAKNIIVNEMRNVGKLVMGK